MSYITREDGERFVIPSYRDTISAKKPGLLKKEVLLLSSSYGEYVTFHKKGSGNYEVAFSPDPGYLLGECIWHHFKRPTDMVYCEAIPNTFEAILVIVKSGSVYLDGTFPIDSIPEELVVFKTQQTSFNIYVYGDVPISQEPEPGKFSFDHGSTTSFTVLDAPVFATLPGVKAFQLQLVDSALRAEGIGALPVKKLLLGVILLGIGYFAYQYLSTHETEIPASIISVTSSVPPYQNFTKKLTAPDPGDEMRKIYESIFLLNTIPGWYPDTFTYTPGIPDKLRASVKSNGIRVDILYAWAYKNNAVIEMLTDGYYATVLSVVRERPPPDKIYRLQNTVTNLVDTLSFILPGNNLIIGNIIDKKVYQETTITLKFDNIGPLVFNMIANYLKGYPLVIEKAAIQQDNTGLLSGTITFTALGN